MIRNLFESLHWYQVVFVLIIYVSIRALLLQGGVFLLIKTKWAETKRIYQLPFSKGQLKSELVSTLIVIFVDALFIASLIKSNWFLYSSTGLLYSFIIQFVWFEIWFYVSHRILHTKHFYFLHKQHHVAKVTSPFTVFSFSIVERLVLLVGSFLLPVILSHFMPMSFLGGAIYLLTNYILNIMAHSNIEFFPSSWLKNPLGRFLNAPTYHALHHSRYNGHFGLFTPYLDKIFGTYYQDYEVVQEKASQGEGLKSLGHRFQKDGHSI